MRRLLERIALFRIMCLTASTWLIMVNLCVAQQQEQLTVTTFYPSADGVYEELRLYPASDPDPACDAENKGLMYYDDEDNDFKFCVYSPSIESH